MSSMEQIMLMIAQSLCFIALDKVSGTFDTPNGTLLKQYMQQCREGSLESDHLAQIDLPILTIAI